MDQDNTQWIRPYLEPGEQILWLGKPETLHLLAAQDVFLIPFSLLWFGFAVFWEITVFRMGTPWFFPLFGAFFVMIGLYLTVGRFLWKAYVLRHTLYAITDRKTKSTNVLPCPSRTIGTGPVPSIFPRLLPCCSGAPFLPT